VACPFTLDKLRHRDICTSIGWLQRLHTQRANHITYRSRKGRQTSEQLIEHTYHRTSQMSRNAFVRKSKPRRKSSKKSSSLRVLQEIILLESWSQTIRSKQPTSPTVLVNIHYTSVGTRTVLSTNTKPKCYNRRSASSAACTWTAGGSRSSGHSVRRRQLSRSAHSCASKLAVTIGRLVGRSVSRRCALWVRAWTR
jgi:hypothetical protein